ncbi:MAG: iron ABC transporter permease [Chloroflexi bacterium]|nr:iron ABC transporter permease [Chloroflexota bacterium]
MTRRGGLVVAVLSVALLVACLLAAGIGQFRIPIEEVLGSVLHRVGIDGALPLPSAPRADAALWEVRFPRVVLGALVGMALGTAGALMQGVFGNPLAEPSVIGVSSGAAVGAFLIIVLGITTLGGWTVPIAAFVGGFVATLLVYALARSGGRTEVVTLVLVGIAVNAFAGAAIGLLTFVSNDDALRAIAFWNLGSLSRATWEAVVAVAPFVLVGLVVAIWYAPRLDLLSLGERAARHLGVDVERLRLVLITVIAALVGAGVAFTGVIGFVGLVIPHLVRIVTGPSHRVLIPASALGGAIVVVVGDLIARTAIENQEMPLGVLTALVGGPFFFWLVRRTRERSGGWA